MQEPEYLKEVSAFRLDGMADTIDPIANLKALLASPSIASKNRATHRQHDIAHESSVVGLAEKPGHITTQWFNDEGDIVVLLGDVVDTKDPILGLGGSAYLQAIHGKQTSPPPRCDLDQAKTLHTTLLGLIQSGLVKSAQNCSVGGLAVALAESCVSQPIAGETPRLLGATIDLTSVGTIPVYDHGADMAPIRLDALLFGETQNRVVVSCKPLDAVKVIQRAKLVGVPAARLGTVGGDKLVLKTSTGEFSGATTELHDGWRNAIARAIG